MTIPSMLMTIPSPMYRWLGKDSFHGHWHPTPKRREQIQTATTWLLDWSPGMSWASFQGTLKRHWRSSFGLYQSPLLHKMTTSTASGSTSKQVMLLDKTLMLRPGLVLSKAIPPSCPLLAVPSLQTDRHHLWTEPAWKPRRECLARELLHETWQVALQIHSQHDPGHVHPAGLPLL